TRLSSEQTVLSSVSNVLNSARSTAIQGINGTLSSSDRSNMATALTQLRNQLVQLANSPDSNGNALFAGTSTTTTPFVQNAAGTVSYAGNDMTQMASAGPGLRIPTSDAGSGIFMNIPSGNGTFTATAGNANTGTLVVGANSVTDPVAWSSASASSGGGYVISFGAGSSWTAADANGNPVLDSGGNPVGGTYQEGGSISFNGMSVTMSGTPVAGDTVGVQAGGKQDIFAALNNMIGALQSGGTPTQISNTLNRQIESLDQVAGAVTGTEVSIGGRIGTLNSQKSAYEDLGVTYKATIASVEGVDVYTAISNLSSQSAALQASQQVFAKVNSMSLFNYIK
ncbi:MAG: flagellar hook-associated protein FlgL, partial [Rhodanobacter sp.]